MRIGEILIAQGLATAAEVEHGLERQKRDGGPLGATLVAMHVISVEQLLRALQYQRERETALELCEVTLHRCQIIYGAVHPNTSGAHHDLARALLGASRAADAAIHAEAALIGYTETMGADHDWTHEAATLVAEARRAASLAG